MLEGPAFRTGGLFSFWRSFALFRDPGLTNFDPILQTARLRLRAPRRADHRAWAALRGGSEDFLKHWEPEWAPDHLSRGSFRRRVSWAQREIAAGRSYPFLIFLRADDSLVGGVTIEHVRRGAAMSGALGYWIGQPHARRGYMAEALQEVVAFAFTDLGLSRLEAACLQNNAASRRLLEKCGFQLEGSARGYLQIAGEWRDHLLYERRRADRIVSSAPGDG